MTPSSTLLLLDENVPRQGRWAAAKSAWSKEWNSDKLNLSPTRLLLAIPYVIAAVFMLAQIAVFLPFVLLGFWGVFVLISMIAAVEEGSPGIVGIGLLAPLILTIFAGTGLWAFFTPEQNVEAVETKYGKVPNFRLYQKDRDYLEKHHNLAFAQALMALHRNEQQMKKLLDGPANDIVLEARKALSDEKDLIYKGLQELIDERAEVTAKRKRMQKELADNELEAQAKEIAAQILARRDTRDLLSSDTMMTREL